MHTDSAEARELIAGILPAAKSSSQVDVLVCPPFTALSSAREAIGSESVQLGAQNLYWEPKGAFTGEISADMLKDHGCTHVILGHSERRHVMGETDEMVNKKVLAALGAGLIPVLCVGELLEEREKGITEDVVRRHVTEGLKGVSPEQALQTVIAYEPVWAIGTGKTATPDTAQEVHGFIRKLLGTLYDEGTAGQIRILYGGSVKPGNAADLMSRADIDGALVGGASLTADSFSGIIGFGN